MDGNKEQTSLIDLILNINPCLKSRIKENPSFSQNGPTYKPGYYFAV